MIIYFFCAAHDGGTGEYPLSDFLSLDMTERVNVIIDFLSF